MIAISASASAISADMLSARAGSEAIMRPGVRCRPGNTARSSTRSPRQTMKLDPSSPRMRLSMAHEGMERRWKSKCNSMEQLECRSRAEHASACCESQAHGNSSAWQNQHAAQAGAISRHLMPCGLAALLLQAVPAEAVIQPATQDLRMILVGRAWGREVGAALRLAEVGIEVLKPQRPLLGRCIFNAATDGPAGPRLGAGNETVIIASAVSDAAGAIEQEVIGRDAGARAQCADPALLIAEVRQIEPVGANEIDAAATGLAFNSKHHRAILVI